MLESDYDIRLGIERKAKKLSQNREVVTVKLELCEAYKQWKCDIE